MKNIRKIIAVVLTLVMALSLTCVFASAEENEMTVVVSLEGLTIGQGVYLEPTAYTLDEVNEILAAKGYATYTEANLTAAAVTVAAFIDNGIEAPGIGDPKKGFYLSSVKGVDTGVVNIPAEISEISDITNEDNDGNDDEYLGEFDYSFYAGWMFFANNEMAPVGASDYVFSRYPTSYENTWVIRWQFSVFGWGVDLGGDGWGMFPEINGEFVNRDNLYIAYANSKNASAKAEALKVINTYLPSQADVDAAINALNAPDEEPSCSHICHSTNKFLSFIWKIANFFNKLFGIKNTCACGAAHY